MIKSGVCVSASPVFFCGGDSSFVIRAFVRRIAVFKYFFHIRTNVCAIVTHRILRLDVNLLIVCDLLNSVIFLIFLHFFCLKILNFATSIISEN